MVCLYCGETLFPVLDAGWGDLAVCFNPNCPEFHSMFPGDSGEKDPSVRDDKSGAKDKNSSRRNSTDK